MPSSPPGNPRLLSHSTADPWRAYRPPGTHPPPPPASSHPGPDGVLHTPPARSESLFIICLLVPLPQIQNTHPHPPLPSCAFIFSLFLAALSLSPSPPLCFSFFFNVYFSLNFLSLCLRTFMECYWPIRVKERLKALDEGNTVHTARCCRHHHKIFN